MAGMTGLETIRRVRSRTSEQCLIEAARFAAVSKMNVSHDTAQALTIAGLLAQTNSLDVPPTRELEIYCVLMEDRKNRLHRRRSLARSEVSIEQLSADQSRASRPKCCQSGASRLQLIYSKARRRAAKLSDLSPRISQPAICSANPRVLTISSIALSVSNSSRMRPSGHTFRLSLSARSGCG